MTVFRQLGDPLAGGVCLCQHHGAAYAELGAIDAYFPLTPDYVNILDGGTVVSVPITITERCCITVNAATLTTSATLYTEFEIERPIGAIKTTQEDTDLSGVFNLLHHAAWEVLDPGAYTYYLVNRGGTTNTIYAAWIKAIASDCEA